MATHKLGVIGLGKIAQDQHLPVIKANPDFELLAVSSQRGIAVDGVPHAFKSWQDMLRLPELDTVAICTPPQPRHEIARAALEAGAAIVNDVTALRGDPELAKLVAEAGCPMVLMHMKGEPKSMQRDPTYEDVVREVRDFLAGRAEHAVASGVDPENVILDPGIGFGKTLEHNLDLLRKLDVLVDLGYPVLVGTSRKSFIGKLTGAQEAKDRIFGTVATTVLAYERGATFFRVHDVRANKEALAVAGALLDAG